MVKRAKPRATTPNSAKSARSKKPSTSTAKTQSGPIIIPHSTNPFPLHDHVVKHVKSDNNATTDKLAQVSDIHSIHEESFLHHKPGGNNGPSASSRRKAWNECNSGQESPETHSHASKFKSRGHAKLTLETHLDFYKNKCIELENALEESIQNFAAADPTYDELTAARSLASSNTSEVSHLRNYANQLNSTIICEKEKSLTLQGEVERLKIVELELTKENEGLMRKVGGGNGGVLKEEVTFFRDCRPERVRRTEGHGKGGGFLAKEEGSLTSPAKSIRSKLGSKVVEKGSPSANARREKSSGASTPVHKAHATNRPSSARRVLRTVYLPNERADALVLMVESLSSQLEEHKKLHDEEIRGIRGELEEREAGWKKRAEEDGAMIENLTKRCGEVEGKWRSATRDLNEVIHKLHVTERESQERFMNYETKLKETTEERDLANTDLGALKKTVQSHSKVHHRNLMNQVTERESDISALREQYTDLQKLYDGKVHALEVKLASANQKLKSLEERRSVEIGEFTKDINFFKNHIRELEYDIMQRKKEEIHGGGSVHKSKKISEAKEAVDRNRNASIVSELTRFDEDYDRNKDNEIEQFYGTTGGNLHSEVNHLKGKIDKLGILADTSGGLGGGERPITTTGGSRKRLDSGTTSERRGTHFGTYKK